VCRERVELLIERLLGGDLRTHPGLHNCRIHTLDDPTTYWKIPASGAYNWVAFDLGSEYTLTGVRITGWYAC